MVRWTIFPPNGPSRCFAPARQRTVGLGHPQDAKIGRIADCYPPFFIIVRMKGLERISAPGNTVKRRVTTSTASGVPQGVPQKL